MSSRTAAGCCSRTAKRCCTHGRTLHQTAGLLRTAAVRYNSSRNDTSSRVQLHGLAVFRQHLAVLKRRFAVPLRHLAGVLGGFRCGTHGRRWCERWARRKSRARGAPPSDGRDAALAAPPEFTACDAALADLNAEAPFSTTYATLFRGPRYAARPSTGPTHAATGPRSFDPASSITSWTLANGARVVLVPAGAAEARGRRTGSGRL